MLLLTFPSQEERRKFGGSAFLEIQFCRMSKETPINAIVAVENIKNWQNDSLYVHEIADFISIYGKYFDGGIHNNMKSGSLDVYGINYYSSDFLKRLIERILNDKPAEYNQFVNWLKQAEKYNGFYILGI